MKNLNMFCLTLEPNHYKFIKELGYIAVGLGDKNFNDCWFSDKSGINISKKNKNYGEYTYHYWIWKNYLDKLDDKWVGFCQYRKFWSLKGYKIENININSINTQVLRQIPEEFENYESILGEPMFVNQWRAMKFLKKAMKIFMKKPILILNKKKKKLKLSF
mgnify:CR=1 FL=1